MSVWGDVCDVFKSEASNATTRSWKGLAWKRERLCKIASVRICVRVHIEDMCSNGITKMSAVW